MWGTGFARDHRGNPAAALAVERLYAAPSMFSGLSTLVLSQAELKVVSQHQKQMFVRLQKLYPWTPTCAVLFTAGSLPAKALLDIKKFSLLGMIARLGPENVLFRQALFSLLHQIKSSWFFDVRNLSRRYSLPDPLTILNDPPSKESFRRLVLSNVTESWHQTLCHEVSLLPSLQFLRAPFLPLNGTPHPLWSSCCSSPSVVRAATVQC